MPAYGSDLAQSCIKTINDGISLGCLVDLFLNCQELGSARESLWKTGGGMQSLEPDNLAPVLPTFRLGRVLDLSNFLT